MSFILTVILRLPPVLLCGVILLACGHPAKADPKPLSKEEQAKVDQAVDKGVAYLKRSQAKEGDWPPFWHGTYAVGQCALPAYALLESGVAADDPVIQKAAAFLRSKSLKTGMTYELSLAILFFDRLGDPKDKKLIQTLALRLLASQHRSGGWSYRCLPLSVADGEALLKSLEKLSKQMKEDGKSAKQALHVLEVPRKLRLLTVFQDPEKFDWPEQLSGSPSTSLSLVSGTDNSNTQFALLALWVAQRHGIPMDLTFRLLVERFEKTQCANGWWPYQGNQRLGIYPYRSMICVGLLGLGIGTGLKLPKSGTASRDQEQTRILYGLTALSQEIGTPAGQMKQPIPLQELYFLWSVERVAMLYNLSTIGDKEWYRWGAEILVTNQGSGGWWPDPPRNSKYFVSNYGLTLNTAFAVLFLKHSHPMRELTPKLPFSAKELNKGIARLQEGDKLMQKTTTTSNESRSIESQSKKRDP